MSPAINGCSHQYTIKDVKLVTLALLLHVIVVKLVTDPLVVKLVTIVVHH